MVAGTKKKGKSNKQALRAFVERTAQDLLEKLGWLVDENPSQFLEDVVIDVDFPSIGLCIEGKRPKDPSVMYITVSNHNLSDNKIWMIRLQEIIDDAIEINECGSGGPIHPDFRDGFAKVSAMLKKCASELDDALARPKNDVTGDVIHKRSPSSQRQ